MEVGFAVRQAHRERFGIFYANRPPPFWVSLSNPGEGVAVFESWSSRWRFDRLTENGFTVSCTLEAAVRQAHRERF
jgi:hypothetical protein